MHSAEDPSRGMSAQRVATDSAPRESGDVSSATHQGGAGTKEDSASLPEDGARHPAPLINGSAGNPSRAPTMSAVHGRGPAVPDTATAAAETATTASDIGTTDAATGAPDTGLTDQESDAPAPHRSFWKTWLGAVIKVWPVLKFVIGIGLGLLAIWALTDRSGELGQMGTLIRNLRWWWIIPAAFLEVCSFLSFARMQHRLLRAGGLVVPFRSLVSVTFAAQSINNSLPAGTAFSALYGFRWYRRFGASEPLAAWALVGTIVGASLSLALVAAGGVVLATSQGASLDLITVVIGVLIVTVAAAALLFYERPLILATAAVIHLVSRVIRHSPHDLDATVERVVGWITVVRLRWHDAVAIVIYGVGNWLFDCACFAVCFWAVGAHIPWEGLLLAYGAGQLAANLPITPGGLGAVEGSITIALVAFGGPQASTVAAVLLYRLISFWAELPVGWACVGVMAQGVRKGRWPRRVVMGHGLERAAG